MSELKVNSIKGVGASTAAITVNNTDGTCTANITNNLSNRNAIINGAMEISQRSSSFNQPADGGYTLDRFAVFRNGAGIMDIEQSTTVPAGEGFKNSLKCTVDTADSSLAGSDFGGLFHKIEGQDITQFEFGNSSAKQFTLSFFVRSNITGTYSVAFRNGSSDRYLVKEYTISSVDTWQKITITDTADLTGTWASDNTTGIDIRWCLWEGGFTAAPNTWGTGNIVGSTNNVNWVATVGNTFYLTGVQFEQNSIATNFEHRSFAQELALCQRYYQKSYNYGVAPATSSNSGMITGSVSSARTNRLDLGTRFETEFRSTPTLTIYRPLNGGTGQVGNFGSGNGTSETNGKSVTVRGLGRKGFAGFTLGSSTGGSLGYHYQADAEL